MCPTTIAMIIKPSILSACRTLFSFPAHSIIRRLSNRVATIRTIHFISMCKECIFLTFRTISSSHIIYSPQFNNNFNTFTLSYSIDASSVNNASYVSKTDSSSVSWGEYISDRGSTLFYLMPCIGTIQTSTSATVSKTFSMYCTAGEQVQLVEYYSGSKSYYIHSVTVTYQGRWFDVWSKKWNGNLV